MPAIYVTFVVLAHFIQRNEILSTGLYELFSPLYHSIFGMSGLVFLLNQVFCLHLYINQIPVCSTYTFYSYILIFLITINWKVILPVVYLNRKNENNGYQLLMNYEAVCFTLFILKDKKKDNILVE